MYMQVTNLGALSVLFELSGKVYRGNIGKNQRNN